MTVLLLSITVLAVVTAGIATFFSWRVMDENRRRSEARVAQLAAAVDAAEPASSAPVAVAHLLEPVHSGGMQRTVALAGTVGLLLVLVVLSFGQLATGPALAESTGAVESGAAAGQAPAGSSLDLLTLTHERSNKGALELRGEVSSSEGGAALNRVTAVALLFDNQGTLVGSERAPLQLRSLDDDTHASFIVSVADATRVARYRISFREGDRIVPHVDRREAR